MTKKKRGRKPGSPFVLRLDDELLRLSDDVLDLAEEAARVRITRSAILRSAMKRGLVEMHAELLARAK